MIETFLKFEPTVRPFADFDPCTQAEIGDSYILSLSLCTRACVCVLVSGSLFCSCRARVSWSISSNCKPRLSRCTHGRRIRRCGLCSRMPATARPLFVPPTVRPAVRCCGGGDSVVGLHPVLIRAFVAARGCADAVSTPRKQPLRTSITPVPPSPCTLLQLRWPIAHGISPVMRLCAGDGGGGAYSECPRGRVRVGAHHTAAPHPVARCSSHGAATDSGTVRWQGRGEGRA